MWWHTACYALEGPGKGCTKTFTGALQGTAWSDEWRVGNRPATFYLIPVCPGGCFPWARFTVIIMVKKTSMTTKAHGWIRKVLGLILHLIVLVWQGFVNIFLGGSKILQWLIKNTLGASLNCPGLGIIFPKARGMVMFWGFLQLLYSVMFAFTELRLVLLCILNSQASCGNHSEHLLMQGLGVTGKKWLLSKL